MDLVSLQGKLASPVAGKSWKKLLIKVRTDLMCVRVLEGDTVTWTSSTGNQQQEKWESVPVGEELTKKMPLFLWLSTSTSFSTS